MIARVRDAYDRLKRLRDNRVRLHNAYRAVFDTEDGRLVLRHLCRIGNVTNSSFTVGSSKSTEFEEGKRYVVLSILRFINKDIDQLVQQIEEAMQKEHETLT